MVPFLAHPVHQKQIFSCSFNIHVRFRPLAEPNSKNVWAIRYSCSHIAYYYYTAGN